MFFAYLLLAIAVSIFSSHVLAAEVSKGYIRIIAQLVVGLAALIIAVQVVAALQLLGVIRALSARALLGTLSVFLFVAVASWTRRPRAVKPALRTLLNLEWSRLPKHLQLGILILCLTYLVFAVRPFFAFQNGYDAIAYHYPVALRWWQDRSLKISSTTDWRFSLLGNLETLIMLSLSSGNDRFLVWFSIPALIALVLALRYFCTRLFNMPEAFWPLSFIVLSIPMICYQAFSGYVDLFGTAMLFAALALFIAADESSEEAGQMHSRSAGLLFVGGLACGITAGTKLTFWPVVLMLLIGFSIHLFRERKVRRASIIQLGVVLLGVALPSIFWIGRGLFETGNPLYPLQIRILGHTLPGFTAHSIAPSDYDLEFVQSRIRWLDYPWTEWKRHTGYALQTYSEVTGLGSVFATFAIPGVLYAVWLCVGRRESDSLSDDRTRIHWGVIRVGLVGILLFLALWWFVCIRNLRYILSLPIAACLISVPFLSSLERSRSRLYRALLLASLASTCTILAYEPLRSILVTIRSHNWSRAFSYGYPELLDHLPPGSVVLNLGTDGDNFPLAGSHLTNRVVSHVELPGPLTAESLKEWNVSYLVDYTESNDDPYSPERPPVSGLQLIYSRYKKGDDGVESRWLIWKDPTKPVKISGARN